MQQCGTASPMTDDKQRLFQKPVFPYFFPVPDKIPKMKRNGNQNNQPCKQNLDIVPWFNEALADNLQKGTKSGTDMGRDGKIIKPLHCFFPDALGFVINKNKYFNPIF